MAQPTPTQYELETLWITEQGIPGVQHRFGDLARIKRREGSGQTAVVIALISIEPEPVYVLDLTDGSSVVRSPQQLDPTGAGRRS